MHYQAEIVIPPTKKIQESVGQIMDYFRKEKYDKNGNECGCEADWWDWWVVGGRWSGSKLTARIDPKQLEAFHKALTDAKVTVSSFVCGKEKLQPESQVALVDELWRKHCPGQGKSCPLFENARDQYGKEGYADDVCLVSEIPERLTCSRLIVAEPWHDDKENRLSPKRMVCTEHWNGVEHEKTIFNGKVKATLAAMRNDEGDWRKSKHGDHWLVVTVDYHN